MGENEELKQEILEWFRKRSAGGTKTKYYLKDVVKGLPEHEKRAVHKAVNDCIFDGSLMWFSTGSTSMVVLPEYHKG